MNLTRAFLCLSVASTLAGLPACSDSASLLVSRGDGGLPLAETGPGPSSPEASTTDAGPTKPHEMAKSDSPRDTPSSAAIAAAVDADTTFAFDLYGKVRSQDPGKNAIVSPLSVSVALSMTYAGARDNTAKEMEKAMRFDRAGASLHNGHNALTQALEGRTAEAIKWVTDSMGEPPADPASYRMRLVNSVWGEKTYTWERPFLDTLARSYGSGVYTTDFKGQPEASRLLINQWVETETQNKIRDLLPAQSINSDTRMVLVNALHLKLPWEVPFRAEATKNGEFIREPLGPETLAPVTVPFMQAQSSYAYAEDSLAQVVTIPLSGRKLSLVIARPKASLDSYEAQLTAAYWKSVLAARTSSEVQLAVPKFTFTSESISLKTVLQELGMNDAFSLERANFLGMNENPPNGERLFIGNVLHKAMMAVDEKGVEAAAATAVVMVGGTGVPGDPIVMNVNKPFLVSIVDEPTGAILFLGRIYDPTDAGN